MTVHIEVGCGAVMGHGSYCEPGYLCDSCQVLEQIQERDTRTLALLKRVEWITGDHVGRFCPLCCLRKGGVHAPDCELAALIRELEG